MFVWKDSPGWKNMTEELYEVKRQWPVPGSKTGKIEDERCAEQLMYVRHSVTKSRVLDQVGWKEDAAPVVESEILTHPPFSLGKLLPDFLQPLFWLCSNTWKFC